MMIKAVKCGRRDGYKGKGRQSIERRSDFPNVIQRGEAFVIKLQSEATHRVYSTLLHFMHVPG